MSIQNKFPLLGVYKCKHPTICFYKLIDIGTYSYPLVDHSGNLQNVDNQEVAIYQTCDAGGIYISPRVWGVEDKDLSTQPFVISLKFFLEHFEKLKEDE